MIFLFFRLRGQCTVNVHVLFFGLVSSIIGIFYLLFDVEFLVLYSS